MCGRYTVFTEKEILDIRSIIEEVGRKFGASAIKTGEIFPTNTAPILMREDNRLAAFPVMWGFPRWDGKAKKDKYLFRHPGEDALYMAGMVDTFKSADGAERDCFVILTTGATASMSPFHDRMPLILAPNEREDWLAEDGFMRLALARVGPELAWERAG